MALSGSDMSNVQETLMESDPNKFGNRADVEFQWAIKAYHHAETHCNLIMSVDPKYLKLTPLDDELYRMFREEFPDFKVVVLEEDSLQKPQAKAKWREFIEQFKQKVEDYNMGSLIRVDSAEEFTEKNSMLVVRLQFLVIEIARNREGCNDGLRAIVKAKSS